MNKVREFNGIRYYTESFDDTVLVRDYDTHGIEYQIFGSGLDEDEVFNDFTHCELGASSISLNL